jgi:hypothetical protein
MMAAEVFAMSNAKKPHVVEDRSQTSIADQIRSASVDDGNGVVRAGLLPSHDEEARLAHLRQLIDVGDAELAAGKGVVIASPRRATIVAMLAARRGETTRVNSVAELFSALDADDDA